MKSIYQQIWCIGFLLEGEFIRAKVILLRIHEHKNPFLYIQVFSVDNQV